MTTDRYFPENSSSSILSSPMTHASVKHLINDQISKKYVVSQSYVVRSTENGTGVTFWDFFFCKK